MRSRRIEQSGRRGAVTPLAAIMMVVIMAFVALGVDLGYIAVVHAQLQNAADSAALAGASQLLDDPTQTVLALQNSRIPSPASSRP